MEDKDITPRVRVKATFLLDKRQPNEKDAKEGQGSVHYFSHQEKVQGNWLPGYVLPEGACASV